MAMISKRGRQRVYRLVCHLAHADAELHLDEREVLESLRQRLKLDEETAAALEEEAKSGQGLKLKDQGDEAEAALVALAEVFVADGVLHPEETKRLRKIAASVGFSPKQTAQIVQAAMVKLNRRQQASDEARRLEEEAE